MRDVRFPTSLEQHGSDAMVRIFTKKKERPDFALCIAYWTLVIDSQHTDPDYSVAYVVIETTDAELNGYGLTFTVGKGTEIGEFHKLQLVAQMLVWVIEYQKHQRVTLVSRDFLLKKGLRA